MLLRNETITDIKLSTNKIGDDGTKEIAITLGTNKSVTTLNLTYNGICDNDALALGNILVVNETIIDIKLSTNKIGDDGAKEIDIALGTNTFVTTLNLTYNAIGDDCALVLTHILARNKALMDIKLSGNIGDISFVSILYAHTDPRMWLVSYDKVLMVNDQAMKLFKEDFEDTTMRDMNENNNSYVQRGEEVLCFVKK